MFSEPQRDIMIAVNLLTGDEIVVLLTGRMTFHEQ